jgi:hypothetical protein
MNTKNIKTIFFILKELILLIKLLVDEWEKDEKDGENEKEAQNLE